MIRVPLHSRSGIVGFALVDDDAPTEIVDGRWYLSHHGYAVGVGGRARMHRVVLGVTDPCVQVDHINGDRLDNRRSNLREATAAENAQNRVAGFGGSSRYRGVAWHGQRGRWGAYAKVARRRVYIGLFDTEEQAARAAAEFRARHMPFSEDARNPELVDDERTKGMTA